MAEPHPTDETLVHPSQAGELVGGLSSSSIRRLIARGEFPAPLVLSRTKSGHPARVAYVRSELLAWVRSRIERGERAGQSPAA